MVATHHAHTMTITPATTMKYRAITTTGGWTTANPSAHPFADTTHPFRTTHADITGRQAHRHTHIYTRSILPRCNPPHIYPARTLRTPYHPLRGKDVYWARQGILHLVVDVSCIFNINLSYPSGTAANPILPIEPIAPAEPFRRPGTYIRSQNAKS